MTVVAEAGSLPLPCPPPAVDAHAHIFRRDLPLASGAWTRPDVDHTAEDWLATLDRHGIGRGVIAAISLFDDDNDYVREALTRHRDRLRATATVPMDTDPVRLRALAEAGFVGVRLQWRNRDLPDPGDAAHQRFFRRLTDAGLHIELLARGADLPRLLPAITASGVDLVIDHLGDPGSDDPAGSGMAAMLRAIDGGRTLVKLSATTRIAIEVAAAAVQRLLAAAGAERMVWGSDAPFVGHAETKYENVLGTYARLVPDPATRAAMGQTALDAWFR